MSPVAIAHNHKRLALLALALAALLAFALTRASSAPAGAPPLVVNSTANTSDGLCDATNCTLREAIDDANDAAAALITFAPAAFPPGAPGVIDIEGGDGLLPAITTDLTIDATGAGVTIDGDATDNNIAVGPGLAVTGSHDAFSFTLLGDGGFTIRDIGGRAIDIVGQTFALDTLTIDAITITDNTSHAIYVTDISYAANVSLTDSTIRSGNTGLGVVMDGPNIPGINFAVTGNDIDAALTEGAAGGAILMNMMTALVPGSVAEIAIDDNVRLQSAGASGVRLAHCVIGLPCVWNNVQINASISDNGVISAGGDAIQVRLGGNPTAAPGSLDSSLSLHLDRNTEVSGGSDGIDIVSRICCGSGNTQTLSISGNGAMFSRPGGSDVIDAELAACCSDGVVTADISGNTSLTAQEGDAMQFRLLCCGERNLNIHNNEMISSVDDNGINLVSCVDDHTSPAGGGVNCINNSNTLLSVVGNTIANSAEDGIHVCCGQFERDGERSVIAGNTISNNARDGIGIETSHGFTIGPANVITANGASGDNDNSAIEIDNFGSLVILDLYGVEVPSNTNTITRNQIHGNVGLGIDLVGYDPLGDPLMPALFQMEYAVVGCNPVAIAPLNANDCLAAPTLSGVSNDAAAGQACDDCLVEVFLANDLPQDQPDGGPGNPPQPGLAGDVPPPQHGEGAVYLTSGEANSAGNFSIELPCGLAPGALTATATDEDGNTSEFAQNVVFNGTSGEGCAPTATATAGSTEIPTPTQTPPLASTPTATATCACITPPAATPTRTPTPTATPTSDASVCGDVNGDGSVNSIDAAFVLQYSAGLIDTLVVPEGADTNGDGSINSIDAALILQNTAGLLDELNC